MAALELHVLTLAPAGIIRAAGSTPWWQMTSIGLSRNRSEALADGLAVALAASIPWSTSATGVFAALWLLTYITICDFAEIRRVILRPAGGLPLLLIALGAAGMLWAGVSWAERFNGFGSYLKLAFIPLLLCHFNRSERAHHVVIGFLASCTVMLILSWTMFAWVDMPLPFRSKGTGIPVKDYIAQGGMFSICAFIVARFAWDFWRAGSRYFAIACALLAVAFLANIFYVATSRTSLVVVVILLIVFGYRQAHWKGMLGLGLAFLLLMAIAWPSAEYFRERVSLFAEEVQAFHPEGDPTPAGERMEFWKKSIGFIKEAPVFGHGTGSIREQFARAAAGKSGMAGEVSANPHNQIFAVGIQTGIIGIGLLIAMWLAHLMLFQSASVAAWIGLLITVQNIIGSMFNSHLFDFTHGWAYVVGVGIAGGVVLQQTAAAARRPDNTP